MLYFHLCSNIELEAMESIHLFTLKFQYAYYDWSKLFAANIEDYK